MNVWIDELIQASVTFLKNPILYWAIFLSFYTMRKQHKQGTAIFRHAMHNTYTTWRNTTSIAILGGLFITSINFYFGLVLTYEVIVVISVITIILSIGYHIRLLSASFIIGLAYLFLVPSIKNLYDDHGQLFLFSMSFLIGLFLLIEAVSIWRIKSRQFLPDIHTSSRGIKYGLYDIQKLMFIPFFIFVPEGPLTAFLPIMTFGDGLYHIALIPFVTGFSYIAKKELPQKTAKSIATQTILLSFIVLILSIGSLYWAILSHFAVGSAIIGRLYIYVSNNIDNSKQTAALLALNKKPTIFWIEEQSLAHELGFSVGDTILYINDYPIETIDDLDPTLNNLSTNNITYSLINSEGTGYVVTDSTRVTNKDDLGIRFIH